MTKTITVEIDERSLIAAAGLLGTGSDEETIVTLVENAAERVANIERIRAEHAEEDARVAADRAAR
jgi:hypothetical protein